MSLHLLKLTVLVLSINIFVYCDNGTPRHCLDDECSVPISEGYTVMGYSGDHNGKLSFKQKAKVIVYGKPPPKSDSDLWFVEINGKKGFVSQRFLKETKMHLKTTKFLNETEHKHDEVLLSPDIKADVRNSPDSQNNNGVISDSNKAITSDEATVEIVEQIEHINDSEQQIDVENDASETEDGEENFDTVTENDDDDDEDNNSSTADNNLGKKSSVETDIKESSNFNHLETLMNDNTFDQEISPLGNSTKSESDDLIPLNTVADDTILTDVNIKSSDESVKTSENSDDVAIESFTDKLLSVHTNNFSDTSSVVNDQLEPQNESNELPLNVQINPNKIENVVDGTTIYDFDVSHTNPSYDVSQNIITVDKDKSPQEITNDIPSPIPSVINEQLLPPESSDVVPQEERNYLLENNIPSNDSVDDLSSYQNNPETIPNEVVKEDAHMPEPIQTNTAHPYHFSNVYADSRKEGLNLINSDLNINTNTVGENSEIFGKVADNLFQETEISDDLNQNLFESKVSNVFNYESKLPDDYNQEHNLPGDHIQKSHNDNVESVENTEQNSLIDNFLTMLPVRNISALLFSTLLFSDSYGAVGIDIVENQPLLGMSARMVLFLFIVSVTVLTFTLGYYFLDVKRQDGKLVGMVNSLQKDLLCYTKECDMLKDELIITKEKLAGIEDSSFGTDEMVISLKQDIQRRDVKIEDLENELEKTVKELQSTTRAAEQLQSFIDEVLQWKDQTKLEEDMANIEQLQEENDKLISELETAKNGETNACKELEALKHLYDDTINITKVQQHEIDSLKEALTGLHGSNISSTELSSIIDQSEIRAQLKTALQEKDSVLKQMEDQKSTLNLLETELKTTMDSLQKSEQATTRLEVLCDHFKKREADLAKELNSKETLWLSTQGETMTTIEKMQSLQTEVQQYKDMCTELRRELADAEASRRSDEAELEKRAHSAWLDARKAQREAEAHKAEAAALRRRLAAPPAAVPPHPAAALSPPLPHMPPPLPPPMLPPLARPPPLGRHPSPPYSPTSTVLANSPPPRYSDYISERDYSERRGRSPYSPVNRSHQRRRSYSNERYYDDDRRHNHMTETETDYSPPPSPRHRRSIRSPRHGPSSGSGQSSDSDK